MHSMAVLSSLLLLPVRGRGKRTRDAIDPQPQTAEAEPWQFLPPRGKDRALLIRYAVSPADLPSLEEERTEQNGFFPVVPRNIKTFPKSLTGSQVGS